MPVSADVQTTRGLRSSRYPWWSDVWRQWRWLSGYFYCISSRDGEEIMLSDSWQAQKHQRSEFSQGNCQILQEGYDINHFSWLVGFCIQYSRIIASIGCIAFNRNFLNLSTWSAILLSSQNYPMCHPMYIEQRTSWFPGRQRCFKYHDIRYPPRAGLASTIINDIDCYHERHWPLKMASLVYERINCCGGMSK